jgi:hypothetical protein
MPKKNNVKPLKIMIETNVSEKPFPLTFSNIYNPLVSEIPSNVVMNEYPYFIETIPYPEEILAKKEYSELLRVFFNEDEFINTIVKRSSHASNADYDIEIVEKNIIIMLNLIFPTSYPSSNNINTSFNKYLQKIPYELKIDLGELTRGLNFSGSIDTFFKREYSYLKINGKTYTVSEITWLNDMLNDPLYRQLIDKLFEYNEWLDEARAVMAQDISNLNKNLLAGLKPIADEKTTDEKKTGNEKSFRITDTEIDSLRNQRQIFTKDELDDQITKIVKFFIDNVSDRQINDFLKEIEKSSVTKKYFEEKFNEFSKLSGLRYKNLPKEFEQKDQNDEFIQSIINDINQNKMSNYSTISSVPSSVPSSEILKKFLWVSVSKFNHSNELVKNSRLYSVKKDVDENIAKLMTNINKINDISKSESTNIDVTNIISIIESIETFFNKIKTSGELSKLSKIEMKINNMMKLSNEIKALELVKTNILADDKGIFVYYDTEFSSDDKDKKLMAEELKKGKYAPFINTVNAINTLFLKENRKTMNQELQKIMNEYFTNVNAELKKKIIDVADDIINEHKIVKNFDNLWNTSITYQTKENASQEKSSQVEPEYEINLYIQVIEGELNPSNKSSVDCNFLDEKLTEMFDQLTKDENNFELIKSSKTFSIDSEMEKNKKEQEERKKEIATVIEKSKPVANEKKGGKYRKSRKPSKRNRYATRRTRKLSKGK